MRRRATIAGLVLLALWGTLASDAVAQASSRMHRVAVLSTAVHVIDEVRRWTIPELVKEGFVEGQNLTVDFRVGPVRALPRLASELLSAKPDVIVAVSAAVVAAAKEATTSVPIVMAFTDDPIALGFVTSLSRPGGNITGQTLLGSDLEVMRLGLLHEGVPQAHRVAVLVQPPRHDVTLARMRALADQNALDLLPVPVHSTADYEAAFLQMRSLDAQALVIPALPDFARDGSRLATLANDARLPSMCHWSFMAKDGCLFGYGPDYSELRRRTAMYIARILKGTPAGEIPIEEPTKFAFAVNLRTAKALGLVISPTLLARADEVIE